MDFGGPVSLGKLFAALGLAQNEKEGRPIKELLESDDPLRGTESQRLRTFFTNSTIEPTRDLDAYGGAVLAGNLDTIKADFSSRVSRLLPETESEESAQAAAAQELYRLRWCKTRIPIFYLILLSRIILPRLRAKHLAVAKWLIDEAKVPVDGTDVTGAQAISHAISTKPAFDPEYAQILYDAGGDINHRNRHGGTTAHDIALVWVLDNAPVSADALAWFFAHGGNIDIKDNDGRTARMCIEVTRGLVQERRLDVRLPTWDVVEKEDERRRQLGMKICAFCGLGPQDEKVLPVCSRCRKVAYCSSPRRCQRLDWPVHKERCISRNNGCSQ